MILADPTLKLADDVLDRASVHANAISADVANVVNKANELATAARLRSDGCNVANDVAIFEASLLGSGYCLHRCYGSISRTRFCTDLD